MARHRTIKPEFWTSEQVVRNSPLARLLFIGIWNFCDDAGIIPSSRLGLKLKIFPNDNDINIDVVDGLIQSLIETKLITEFTADDGKDYLSVTGWQHQKIEKPTYRYPTPKASQNSTTSRRDVADVSASPRPQSRVEKSRVSNNTSIITNLVRSDVIAFPKLPNRFDEFYEAYPRKQNRKRALQAWNKLNCDALADRIIRDVLERKQHHDQWLRDNGRFIPHPATYLNGECWTDEINIKPINKEANHAKGERMLESLADRAKRQRDALRVKTGNVFDNASGD